MSALVDAVLPAGGRIIGAFAAEAGAEVKALIRIGGETLLQKAIRALRDCGSIGRIVVIGPTVCEDAATGADMFVEEADSGPENIRRGLEQIAKAQDGAHAIHMRQRVLVLTTDLPFVTPQAINAFLQDCSDSADICVPALKREQYESRFPDSPAIYVRLRDGDWTAGSCYLVNPAAIEANRASIDRVFAARKSQFAMARLLGPLIVARFITNRLEVRHIEDRCRRILGCTGAAVLNCPPELAFDIDLPEEFRYAREYLQAESHA